MGNKKRRRGLQVQAHQTAQVLRASKYESHSGPIPRPVDLEHYNNIHPGLADRIMKMAESQSLHRQNLENSVVGAGIKSQSRAQIFAFIIAMSAIIGGIGLAAFNKSTAGITTIISTLTVYTGVFIWGKKKQSNELAEKREEQS